MSQLDTEYVDYSYLSRGSDERQYCAPGIDLPVVSMMRTKYLEYPEYHTSKDDLTLITASALGDSFELYKRAIFILEKNTYPKVTVLGEPQLGKRGLYPNLSTLESYGIVQIMMNFFAYCDGKNSILDIARMQDVPFERLYGEYEKFIDHGLVKPNEKPNV
jgi:aminopeptidase-like protein